MDKNENETQYGRRDFLRLGATAAAGVAAAGAGAGLVDVARAADPRVPAGALSVAIWGGPPDIQSLKDAVNRYQKQYPQVHMGGDNDSLVFGPFETTVESSRQGCVGRPRAVAK